jgi:hypothetical protein
MFDFAFGRGGFRGGLFADGRQLHAADRAVAGLVLDHLRVHPARVELFLFGPGSGAMVPTATGQKKRRGARNSQQQPEDGNKFHTS